MSGENMGNAPKADDADEGRTDYCPICESNAGVVEAALNYFGPSGEWRGRVEYEALESAVRDYRAALASPEDK